MESLLGAIYLEHGIEGVREVILRVFGPTLDAAPTLGAGLDWKTSLQELTAARGLGTPTYLVTSTGPDHDKRIHRGGRRDGHRIRDRCGPFQERGRAESRAAAWAWKRWTPPEKLRLDARTA